ncbi:kinase-like domain-containing protein [Xylaria venustula]|nr:kinase-like domain-containing protein [Xylaria venustula]
MVNNTTVSGRICVILSPTINASRGSASEKSSEDPISFDWPPPVRIEPLGLFIKYGTQVTVTEIQTQILIREKLLGRVPIPEVFGWTYDHGQTFLYMSLVDGDPLHESVYLAKLETGESRLLYRVHKQPLRDIFFTLNAEVVGPFQGVNAVQQFQDALGIDIADPGPVVFTHNDLVACNILVTKETARIAAIVDWGQAGWYPAYWEFCKAQRVNVPDERFFNEYEEEWKLEYLPRIVDAVDTEDVWYPFLQFAISKI